MADTKPRHTNNINILPGENITFDQEDQNITINAVIPTPADTATCFPGGTYYLGGPAASDGNAGTDPAAPIATWARMRQIMGCLPITGPTIVKVRQGTYSEPLEISGKVFSRRGSITVMATDEDAFSSSPYYISHVDAITGRTSIIRTVESATSNTITITDLSNLSTDELMGRRVRFIGGPSPGGSDTMRAVFSNDSSVLTLDRELSVDPTGTEVVLERPGVVFSIDEAFTEASRPYYIGGCIGEDLGNTDGQLIDQIQFVGITFHTSGLITDFETFGNGGKITGNKGINIRFTACEEQTTGPEWSNNEHIIISNKYYWPDAPQLLDVGYGLVIGSPIDPTDIPVTTGRIIIRKVSLESPYESGVIFHSAFSIDEDEVITIDPGFDPFSPPESGPITFRYTLTKPDLTTEDLELVFTDSLSEIILSDMLPGSYTITEHVDATTPGINFSEFPWNAEDITIVSAMPSLTDLSTPLIDVSATIDLSVGDTTVVVFSNSVLLPSEF